MWRTATALAFAFLEEPGGNRVAPIQGLGLCVAVPVALEAATPGARSPAPGRDCLQPSPRRPSPLQEECVGLAEEGTLERVSLAVEPFACFCHLPT